MVTTTDGAKEAVRAPAKLQQLPGLDGLRALAVVAVIVYHLNPSWLPGGFLGVDIFFVISGYLITALLLAEGTRGSGIHLGAFWRRRAKRLLPAVIALLLLVILIAAVTARDSLGRLQGDVPASLFYVMNWHLLLQHQSYVASFGRPPLLQHLWSLSVEEQFYLLWPISLIFLRKRMAQTRVAGVAAGGALASALLMALLYRPGHPSAVYFGTETHAVGLLIGCALAAAVPPWRMATRVPTTAKRLLERAGLISLAAVVAGLATLGFNAAFTYRGGMLLLDLATAVVIATVAHPATRLGPLLGRQPWRWIGLRSYSLYLWHWPIFELTRPGADLTISGWPVLVLRLALTAGAAELSYRWVEQPWRTGRAQRALRAWLARARPSARFIMIGLPTLAVTGLLASAPASSAPAVLLQGSTPAARLAPGSTAPAGPTTSTTVADSPGLVSVLAGQLPRPAPRTTTTRARSSRPPAPSRTTVARRPPPPSPEPILAIGDSVLLAASPALSQAFAGHITIDAQVGRQVQAGLDRLQAYRASGALGKYRTVLIDLGTNGTFLPAQFSELVELVKGVPHVIVYNVHAARPWAATSNATIAAGVASDPHQMLMVDWDHVITTPLLYSDEIHPDPAGAGVYAHLLAAAIKAPTA